jgi:sugar (pentulose or hexulose) kinase
MAGVVITTQRGTTIALDKNGQPLRPAMIWLDQRRADITPKPALVVGGRVPLIGMRDTVKHFQKEAEANWIAQHQPRSGRAPTNTCCSRATSTTASPAALSIRWPVSGGLCAVRLQKRLLGTAHDWKWQAMPIKPSMLPELVPAGTVIGKVSAQVAATPASPRACR